MYYYSSNALLSCYIMCPSDYDSTDYANHSNMILQNDDYFVDFKVEVEFIMMIIVISWHLPLFMPSKTCFSVDNQITEFIKLSSMKCNNALLYDPDIFDIF